MSDKSVFVDRQSARFGGIGGLSFGFGMGWFMVEAWIPGAWLVGCGLYALYRSHNADVRTLGDSDE